MRAVLPAAAAPGAGDQVPQLGELPDPVAGVGEVVLVVEAAGLNRADLLQLAGQYPPPAGESAVPGLECCGRIAALGPGVERWQVGARVMALLAGGGQATRVAVPAAQLMPLPENLSTIEGAAIPEAGLTAWTNLVAEGHLVAGESVLITGATGGVGSFAVQLARELGARVFAAARDGARLERLRELGVEELLEEGDGLAERLRKLTGGRGVDLVFDLIGGARLPVHLAALKTGGRLVLLGLLAGSRVDLELYPLLRRRLHLIGSVLRGRSRDEKARLVASFTNFALPRLREGRLRPLVDRVFPLERVAEAYAAIAAGGLFGKIVIAMP